MAFAVLSIVGCSSPEEKAKSHYARGAELLAQKNYVKAAIEFKNALQLKQDLVGAWQGLAQIEEHNQNWEGLSAILRKIAELDPKDIDARLRFARLMLMANALDEALKAVNAATDLDAANKAARALKAAILLKLNDSGGAVREAKAVLDAEPDNVEALIVLAAERVAQGDNAAALALLDKGSRGDSNFGIQLFKIRIHERAGNIQEVESLLQKLIQAYPKEKAFRRQLVKLYVDQKRPADAERELRAIAAGNPTDYEAGLDVVRYLHSVKGPAAARQELLARIGAGGDAYHYQVALADLYFAEGNVTDGEQILSRLASDTSAADKALGAKAKLAEHYYNSKRTEQAETLVASILEKDSRNADGLRLRASIQMDRGKYDAAIADLRQALNDQPRSVSLMSLLAIAYERSGSIELADKQFADATRVSNFDVGAGLNYVAFLRRRGSIARAEDILTQLTSRWPGNIRVLTELAEVRLTRQNWGGAQEVADAIRRAGDERGVANQILGAALNGQRKYDESIGILQSAYAATPGDAQPMFALVNTLIRADKVDRAMAFLRTVLEKDNSNAEAHVLMGSAQLIKNAPDQALKSFSTAIERQPKNPIGYRALADWHLRQNKPDDALKVVQAGLREMPDNSTLQLVQAGLFEMKGDYEAAIEAYERMTKQESGSMVVANNLASLLADHRTDKASHERAYLLAASLRKSQVPQFKDTLGWIHYLRGEHRVAAALLEEAVAQLPDMALVRYHLAMSYVALGEPAKASEHFKKALELSGERSDLPEKIKAELLKVGN
ncbi:MAG: tetratricopeptide repeat protein [Bacteroidota bacterium]